MEIATKDCPRCGTQLDLTAGNCTNCGTRFVVTLKGYCPNCKAIVEASEESKCSQCGGELMDPHIESKFWEQEPQPGVKHVEASPVPQAMIHCQKCNAQNLPSSDRCLQCRARLLPAEGVAVRIVYLLTGLIVGLIMAYLTYLYLAYPDQVPSVCPGPVYVGGAALFFPIIGLAMALRKTPMYVRYENRAKRHTSLNPLQAVADFSQALALAPEKERAGLLKQRAQVYEKLGMQKDATRDILALTSDPGAFQNEALLMKWIGADSEVYMDSRRYTGRAGLLASGKAKAVGYCPKCKDVVEIDAEEHCLVHKSRKAKYTRLVLPDEIEEGKREIRQAMQGERRIWNRKRILYIISIVFVIYALYVLYNNYGGTP